MTYTAFGSYAPVYIDAQRNLTENLGVKAARATMWVLWELCNHADEHGLCYPGIKRLANLTHYSPDTVRQALINLVELDYLTVHIEKTLRGINKTYQLSPYVLYVAAEQIENALSIWNSRPKISYVKRILMKVSQPESESESEPEVLTRIRNQNQNHHQQNSADKPLTPHPDADDIQREAQDPRKKLDDDYPDQREAQTNQRVAPNTEKFKVPLTDRESEKKAMELSTWGGGTNRHQARYLVFTYGGNKVQRAMQHIESLGTQVRSPQGLLRTLLQNNTVPEPIQPDDTDLNQSEYAHLFK